MEKMAEGWSDQWDSGSLKHMRLVHQEYFKGGFSYGEDAKYRLVKGVQKKVPLVISVGGLDFYRLCVGELPERMDERVYMMHNANTAHIKLLPDEAEITTQRFVDRVNKIDYPVKLLDPYRRNEA